MIRNKLTEDQERGLEIMGKILSKRYPYVIGASPNTNDLSQYSTIFTIKLVISKSKLEEHFNQKVKHYWLNFWRFSNIFEQDIDPEETLINEMFNLGKMFYSTMEDKYQFESKLSSQGFREVRINSFILDDKN